MKKGSRRALAITMLVGLVMGAGVFAARGGFGMAEWPAIAAALCDACFVPAAMLLCLGLLLFAANDGLFDMMTYGVQKALRIIQSEEKRSAFPKSFYDYRVLKQGKKSEFSFLLIAGAIYLVLAVLFLLLSGAV